MVPPGRSVTLAVLLCLVLVPTASAAGQTDVGITLRPDGQAEVTTGQPKTSQTQHDVGQAYAWEIEVTDDYDVAEVRIDDAFGVERGKQIVPLLDGDHVIQLKHRDPADVDQPARVYNLTGEDGTWTYRLGLPGPGTVNLSLHKDVTPPRFEMGEITNLTHFSFDLKTQTPEPALAELVIQGPERNLSYPTNTPGVWQRFPAQGLDPDTTYSYHVVFEDWSGNQATSQTYELTTLPEPERPEVTVRPVAPTPNSTVPAGQPVVIEAAYESPESPVRGSGIRLFFDKEEIDRSRLTVEGATVRYEVPGPLKERIYSVSVEVPNMAGGVGETRWSFTVGDPAQSQAPGLSGWATLIAGLTAAVVVARLGRH